LGASALVKPFLIEKGAGVPRMAADESSLVLEAMVTGLEQALGIVNVRLNEIERRADREEGAAVAAVEELECKLGELGFLPEKPEQASS
jgi:hypothetical protein